MRCFCSNIISRVIGDKREKTAESTWLVNNSTILYVLSGERGKKKKTLSLHLIALPQSYIREKYFSQEQRWDDSATHSEFGAPAARLLRPGSDIHTCARKMKMSSSVIICVVEYHFFHRQNCMCPEIIAFLLIWCWVLNLKTECSTKSKRYIYNP